MYYKLRIEEVDYDKNTIKCTEVWVTEEMIKNSHSVDILKMGASQLIDKFRNENNLKEPHDEYNVYRHVIESPMIDLEQFEINAYELAKELNKQPMTFVIDKISDKKRNFVFSDDKDIHSKQIKNGDVFDIGQTVNGVSKFLWFNNTWYYFEERMSWPYEYDQSDLTNLILDNEFEEVTFVRNIFTNEQ